MNGCMPLAPPVCFAGRLQGDSKVIAGLRTSFCLQMGAMASIHIFCIFLALSATLCVCDNMCACVHYKMDALICNMPDLHYLCLLVGLISVSF
jgi:hypothetical protein